MPNAWLDALKKWNSGKGMWCLPKKGSKEHSEVVALMKGEKVPEPAPKEESRKEHVAKALEQFKAEKAAKKPVRKAPKPEEPKPEPKPEPEPKSEPADSEEEMKKKASAAADAAVNKFIMKSKSQNRSYLAARRRAIEKKVYAAELERLRAEAKTKKVEKVAAIIAHRVHNKKLRNM